MHKTRSVKKQTSPLGGILIGIAAAILVSLIFCLVAAGLLNSEKIGEGSVKYTVCGVQVVSLIIGILIAQLVYKERAAIISVAVSGVYFVLLLCINLLFYDGSIRNIGLHLLCILASTLVGILPTFKKEKVYKKRRPIRSR